MPQTNIDALMLQILQLEQKGEIKKQAVLPKVPICDLCRYPGNALFILIGMLFNRYNQVSVAVQARSYPILLISFITSLCQSVCPMCTLKKAATFCRLTVLRRRFLCTGQGGS